MNKKNIRFKILIIVLFIGKAAFAQQNLFNIPNGDVNEKNKIFYQHQINLYQNNFESKAHFVYGIGNGWDIGLNLVGKGFFFSPEWRVIYNDNPNKGALYPYLMPTIQKQFTLKDNLRFNIGTQSGFNLSSRLSNKEFAFFNYGLGVYYFNDKKSRIILGAYHTNRFFVGQGNTFGALFGYEIKVAKRFYLMGDWLSGNNESSVGVFGAMYNVSKRVQLCAGALIPNPDTPKPHGFVLEVNIMTWDLKLD